MKFKQWSLISQLGACLSLFKSVFGFYCHIFMSPQRDMTQTLNTRLLDNRSSPTLFSLRKFPKQECKS